MAKKTFTELVDDLDGSPATSTVSFALSGTTYEVDLSDANAARLDDALAPFIRAGRTVGRASRARTPELASAAPATASGRRGDLVQIRVWAREHGHPVADRGRIAASVQDAYDAAH